MGDLYSEQAEIKVADIAGVAEVCQIIGFSSGYVSILLNENPSFPRPVTTIKAGRIWDAEAVRAWRETYTPNPPGNPAFKSDGAQRSKPEPKPEPTRLNSEQRAAKVAELLGGTV